MRSRTFRIESRYYGRWILQTFTAIVPLAAAASIADRRTPARDRAMAPFVVRRLPRASIASTGRTSRSGFSAFSCRGSRACSSRRPRNARPARAIAGDAPRARDRRPRPGGRSRRRAADETRGIGVFETAEAQALYRRSCRLGGHGASGAERRRSPSTRAARSSTTRSFHTSAGTRSGPRDGRRCEPASKRGASALYALLYPRRRRASPSTSPAPGERSARSGKSVSGRLLPLEPPDQRTRMTRRNAVSPPSRATAVTVSVWPPGARLGIAKWNPSRGPSGFRESTRSTSARASPVDGVARRPELRRDAHLAIPESSSAQPCAHVPGATVVALGREIEREPGRRAVESRTDRQRVKGLGGPPPLLRSDVRVRRPARSPDGRRSRGRRRAEDR